MKIGALLFVTLFFILLNAPLKAVAGADIYKYVDKDGNITFTNRRISNGQKITLASYSKNVGQQSARSKLSQSSASPAERDTTRRQILEKELAMEEKLFSETKNFLAQVDNPENAGTPTEKSVQLKNKLFTHQRNIAALRRELGKL